MSAPNALQRDATNAQRHLESPARGAATAQSPDRRRPGLVGPAQLLVVIAIAVGWSQREDRWLVPHEGAGYVLGILGLGLMTLLLAYPMRKRFRLMRGWGRLGGWFEVHMVMGLVGPLAILYHSNFRLGSLNANIALVCMLTVAASGIVGRVIYVRIHEGLSGRRKTLDGMRGALETTRAKLAGESNGAALLSELAQFERRTLGERGDRKIGLDALLALPWQWRRAQWSAFKLLRAERKKRGRKPTAHARRSIKRYVKAVRSVAALSVYERLFALWHVAHLPLTFLLFASAAVHVVAVHMY